MNVYLDVCCLNRPFDDQTQDRVRLEAEAVLIVMRHIEAGDWAAVGSEVVQLEVDQIPDAERRDRVQRLARLASRTVLIDQSHITRAQQLQRAGLHFADALHIACAESERVDS